MANFISSRTPEGWPGRCPVCGHSLRVDPSLPTCDAPCPRCGALVWLSRPMAFRPLPLWTGLWQALAVMSSIVIVLWLTNQFLHVGLLESGVLAVLAALLFCGRFRMRPR